MEERKDLKGYINMILEYDKKGKCINAFQNFSDSNILYQAYNTLKSNPGNMGHGSDKETLDGISKSWLNEASKSLICESYKG